MSSLTFSGAYLLWILSQPSVTQPNLLKIPAAGIEGPHAGIVRQSAAPAQSGTQAAKRGREFFVSWGYNGDSYTKSDLHITQPPLGNDFTLVDVRARDRKQWTNIFGNSLTVPQYNFRFGVFFNERWGLELAHDHIKWIVREDQEVRMIGTLNGATVDAPVTLNREFLRYQLNNGANPLCVNLIRRVRLRGEPRRTGYVAFLAKAGGGFANPHTENVLFGQPNEKGFQFFQGWNVDAVAAVRMNILKRFYLEFEEKVLYVRYFGLKVDRGMARHSVKANEFSFNFGMAFR